MNRLKIFMSRYWKTISVSVSILVLCLMPGSELKNIHFEFNRTDLIVHFVMFFTLSFILYLDSIKDAKKQQHKVRSLLIIPAIASFSFGILTELLQYTIVSLNRSGSLMDLGFDLTGTIAGVSAAYFIKRKSFPAT